MMKFYGSLDRTLNNAAAAIPAFFRMQDDRRFAFLGVGDVNVHLADLDAMVTPVALIGE